MEDPEEENPGHTRLSVYLHSQPGGKKMIVLLKLNADEVYK